MSADSMPADVLALGIAAALVIGLAGFGIALWATRRSANDRGRIKDLEDRVTTLAAQLHELDRDLDVVDADVARIYTWAHQASTPAADSTQPQPAVHIAAGTRNNGATAAKPRPTGAHRRHA